MHFFNGVDRRNLTVQDLALLVDIGVNYYRTLSTAKAYAFLEENEVPCHIIARVLNISGPRRLTHWECTIDEVGIRRALGARPLLSRNGY